MLYDTIIIGGGAAGLTAAIYAARRALKTLVITQDIGGQAATASVVENYPGFESVSGVELMQKFQQQAQKSGAQFSFGEVKKINKKENVFIIKTNTEEFQAKSLILAFGLSKRHLDIPGEEEFVGKGVAYCSTCDGPLYRDKIVTIVGGGSSALEAVLFMSKIAKKVYLIHRRSEFRGEEFLVEQVKKAENAELVLNSIPKEIKGDDMVRSIIVQNVKDVKNEREIKTDGIFIEIGFTVKTDLIKNLVDLDKKNQIIANKNNETSCPGIFAAGDVTDIFYKQVVISAGEGAKAALQAYKFLHGEKGTAGVDWGSK